MTIKIPLFLVYNTFECHFKPNHKKQSNMVDPVYLLNINLDGSETFSVSVESQGSLDWDRDTLKQLLCFTDQLLLKEVLQHLVISFS